MTLTFDTHLTSLTYLFEYLKKKFEAYGCYSFQIIHNFHFCPCKSQGTKFDLGINRSRSTKGDILNNLGSTRVHNATY